MLPEFDQEMANTRKTLERVPDDRFEWTPHPKSFPMGKLATHLANLPSWTNVTIDMDEFDMAPGGVQMKTPECHSQKELLATFDENLSRARKALEGITDEKVFQSWSLLASGEKLILVTANCSSTQLCDESHHSSSSATWSVLALKRYFGAGPLRTFR
jgi:hypothetical protein